MKRKPASLSTRRSNYPGFPDSSVYAAASFIHLDVVENVDISAAKTPQTP
jgi:hypothetical protein